MMGRCRLVWRACLVWLGCVACRTPCHGAEKPTIAGVPAAVAPLLEEIDAGPIAAPATGQSLYVVDRTGGAVIGCDPFRPHKRWTAVAAPADPAAQPVSVACIDSSTLATVRRDSGSWSLQTHRLPPPGGTPPAAAPRTQHRLGGATQGDDPRLAVGFARDWLAVTGLAPPLPQLVAFRIRGATPAGGPYQEPATTAMLVAATSMADDSLVLFTTDPADPSGPARIRIRQATDPRPLLDLDTGLPRVRAAAAGRNDGTLWVLAGTAGSATVPEGLWRIDAVLHDDRQAVRPVCLALLPSPESLVWISERMILVTHGTGARRVVHVDPTRARMTAEDTP